MMDIFIIYHLTKNDGKLHIRYNQKCFLVWYELCLNFNTKMQLGESKILPNLLWPILSCSFTLVTLLGRTRD